MRQQHPRKVNVKTPRPSLSDVIIGCPQTLDVNQRGTGKMLLAFLNAKGYAEDYREVCLYLLIFMIEILLLILLVGFLNM